MPSYRFYFMNQSDSISSVENLDCTGDDEARRHAIDMLPAEPRHQAIEIWALARFVARHDRGAG
jgi:hypothetical protein